MVAGMNRRERGLLAGIAVVSGMLVALLAVALLVVWLGWPL